MDTLLNYFVAFTQKEKTWKFLAFILYISFITTIFFSSSNILFFITAVIVSLFFFRILTNISIKTFYMSYEEIKDRANTYIHNELKKIVCEIESYIPVYIVSCIIIDFIIVGSPKNQVGVVENFKNSAIIYFVIEAVIMAPILEEMIFRLLPYKFITNKYLYIAISSIVFAGLHVINDTNPLYYIWCYIINSVYWSYRFYMTKDVLVTISLHAFTNFIAMLILILK